MDKKKYTTPSFDVEKFSTQNSIFTTVSENPDTEYPVALEF